MIVFTRSEYAVLSIRCPMALTSIIRIGGAPTGRYLRLFLLVILGKAHLPGPRQVRESIYGLHHSRKIKKYELRSDFDEISFWQRVRFSKTVMLPKSEYQL